MRDKELRDITVAAIETAQAVVNDSGEIDRDTANRFLLKLKEELDEFKAANAADAAAEKGNGEGEPPVHEAELSEVGRRVRGSRLDQTRGMIQQARGLIDGLQDFVRWAGYVDEDLASSDVTRGLYLVEPHGAMIADGRKTAVAKSRRFELEGEWILVSGRRAYGVIGLGKPERVNIKEFDERFDEHRVSVREREKWWPTYEHLWLYPVVSMKAHREPEPVVLPRGVQTIIRHVEYKNADREAGLLAKLKSLPDKFVWIPDFVTLTGSQIYATADREPNDVDVVLRAHEHDGSFDIRVPVDASFALKLERLLRDKLGAGKVQYTANAYGSNWRNLPLYDLALVRKPKLEYRELDEPEFAAQQYKARTLTAASLERLLRGATAETRRQAKRSFDEDKVVPGRMVLSLKPMRPAKEGERQLVSNFYSFIDDNLEFPLYVSGKRDGATHYVHSDGKRVWFYSDDGKDNTKLLPKLSKAVKEKFGGKSFVFGAEVEKWQGGEHYPREAAAGAVHSGEEEGLTVNVFRLVYWDGEDLHGKPFEEVWKVQKGLPSDKSTDGKLYPERGEIINIVPHHRAVNLSELKEKTARAAYRPGAEGVVVKRADGTFPLDGHPGTPPTSLKWHKSLGFVGRVTKRTETKTPDVWVYSYTVEGVDEVGKTFGTSTKAEPGDRLRIETEQWNREEDEDGKLLKVSAWVPNVMSKTTDKTDSAEAVTKRARAHGVLREKVRREDGSVEYLPSEPGNPATADKARQRNIDLYPDESKKLRYVFQIHFRGKSAHGDPRFEFKRGDSHYLRGWTTAMQQPGAIKEPVTTMAAAEKAVKNPANWKMDLKTGTIKPREIRGGVTRRGNLRAFTKALEIPADWISVEGVTEKPDPGEPVPVGATREYPGVFVIVAKGDVDWGAQKPWFNEFFLDGDWKGRWTFRLVRRAGKGIQTVEGEEQFISLLSELGLTPDDLDSLPVLLEAEVLPPGKEEERPREAAFWQLMQPLDQTPYVLGGEAVKKNWLPPRGVSCLPKRIRTALPEKYRFWKMDTKEALATRKQLLEDWEELGGPKLVKARAAEFALTRRDFRGPIVIRFGSSTTVYDLFVRDGGTWRLEMEGDPLRGEVAATPTEAGRAITNKVFRMNVGDTVDLEPGKPGNPTKDTPAKLTLVDKGKAQELAREKDHRKYEFKGKKLKGVWFVRTEDGPEGFWLMSRSGGPEVAGLKTFKSKSGRDWLLLWTANAFKDRDGEIFSTKALEDYVTQHEADERKGEFQFWHLPGTKFGDILWQGMSGRFLVEMGPFDDTEMGRTFQKFFEAHPRDHPILAPQGWGASHKYIYNPEDREEGVYQELEKEESSVLPAHEAANPYNPRLEVFSVNEKQKTALATIGDEVGIGGDELVKMVEEIGETRTKELETDGVDYKQKKDFAKRLRDIAGKMKDGPIKNTLLKLIDEMVKAYPTPKEKGEKDLKSIAAKLAKLAKTIGGDVGTQLAALVKELEGYAKPGSGYSYPKPKETGAREADLTELDSGAVLGLVLEGTKATDNPRSPLKVFVKIIEPGWGNARDNNYYPAEVLQRDAHVFEGSKMFATDHVGTEKNVRSEVSIMEKAPVFFTSEGAPVGLACIHNPDFAEATRNRIESGHLESLRCSIYAKGQVQDGFERDGRKGNLVEAIKADPKPDVDWVSRSGAGGHATEALDSETVESALKKTNLPTFAREWLAEEQYGDEAELDEAVQKATARVKSFTGSGQVVGLGQSTAPSEIRMSDDEYDEGYRRIAEKYGLTPVVKEA